MPNEGAVALAIASRLMIHLTGKAYSKEVCLHLLADIEATFQGEEARLVRELAEAIDHSMPDGPNPP